MWSCQRVFPAADGQASPGHGPSAPVAAAPPGLTGYTSGEFTKRGGPVLVGLPKCPKQWTTHC